MAGFITFLVLFWANAGFLRKILKLSMYQKHPEEFYKNISVDKTTFTLRYLSGLIESHKLFQFSKKDIVKHNAEVLGEIQTFQPELFTQEEKIRIAAYYSRKSSIIERNRLLKELKQKIRDRAGKPAGLRDLAAGRNRQLKRHINAAKGTKAEKTMLYEMQKEIRIPGPKPPKFPKITEKTTKEDRGTSVLGAFLEWGSSAESIKKIPGELQNEKVPLVLEGHELERLSLGICDRNGLISVEYEVSIPNLPRDSDEEFKLDRDICTFAENVAQRSNHSRVFVFREVHRWRESLDMLSVVVERKQVDAIRSEKTNSVIYKDYREHWGVLLRPDEWVSWKK